jgi:hypothetical protein
VSTLPGLLIEYLISGTLALIWLVPVLAVFDFDILDDLPLPLLVVSLYVIGMTVDFVAFWLVKPLKRVPRRWALRKARLEAPATPQHSVTYDVRFALYAPELAKEVAMRSSRDRIARGAIVNAVALTVVTLLGLAHYSYPVLIALIVLSTVMWLAFEATSYGFVIRAQHELSEKLSQTKP